MLTPLSITWTLPGLEYLAIGEQLCYYVQTRLVDDRTTCIALLPDIEAIARK